MTLFDKLSKIPGKYHKRTVENVTVVLACILTSRTTNLNRMKDDMARVMGGKRLRAGSYYRRLTRFFERYGPTRLFIDVLLWVLQTLPGRIDDFLLDGTEWKIGCFELHVLVLAARVRGVAVPVYFRVYQHKGVLSEQERINFMRKALSVIDLTGFLLVADREFIGKVWCGFLADSGLDFVIRLRKGIYRQAVEAGGQCYGRLEKRALKKGYCQAVFELEGGRYRIEMWRSANLDEPIVYLITSVLGSKRMGKRYARRWKIEYCFKHLKTNGFNLEDVALTDLKKIRLMVSLVVAAYVLAVREGVIGAKRRKPRTIKYRDGERYLAVSIFRAGLQEIKSQIVTWKNLDTYLAGIRIRNPIIQFV
ncbi:transposase [Persicitalea sp.]|uniref:transposase n=1 Tax=Persicitalea sp. TaxID=3100273 RepID=UPI0035945930